MTSARADARDPGYAGLLMRAGDFAALGETPDRYELINGVVVMSPSPRPKHWKVIQEVLRQVLLHAERTSTPIDTYSDIDLFLDDLTVYRPDLSIYARPQPARLPDRLDTPPTLILEVLSLGSKPLDLITKRDAYERFGVEEYWTIDADDGRMRTWSLENARYRERLPDGNTFASKSLAGFELNLGPILALTAAR